MPEYGRNIQKMVNEAKCLPTKEERNRAAKAIIQVMGNMNPHLRDINDFKHKLWDHLAVISEFDFDIDYPYPVLTPEQLSDKPQVVPYNEGQIRYRYYGRIIDKIIKRAATMPDGYDRDALISVIANHMKKAYLMWNKEIVNDEVIFEDIRTLSGGKISIGKNFRLTDSKEIMNRNKKTPGSNPNTNNSNNQNNQNNNSNNNNRKNIRRPDSK